MENLPASKEEFDITIQLTIEERGKLVECEEIIERHLKTFIEVGEALATIRDNRLYREQYKTFEQYCKEVWDYSKTYSIRQIQSYETIQLLENGVDKWCQLAPKNKHEDENVIEIGNSDNEKKVVLPQNECQVSPLTKLKDPDDQVKAWQKVLEQLNDGKKLTSYVVAKAVEEVLQEKGVEKVEKTKKEVGQTELLSKMFKRQHQVMIDIIMAEKHNNWHSSSRKEAVKYLKQLVKLAESDD